MREQMASAQDTIAEQDRYEPEVDAASARAANVPWTPEGTVYRHQAHPVADDDDTDGREDELAADFRHSPRPAPSHLRRMIPLLWAAALTVAALQHAGEVERRMALREPSLSELDMRDRSAPEIKAAWRSIGTMTISAEVKPVAEKTEPAIAHPQFEQAAARDAESKPQEIKPQETERPLVEPITEVVREATSSELAEDTTKDAAQQPVQDIISAATETKAAEERVKVETIEAMPPVANTDQPATLKRKGRVTTSRATRPHVGLAESARPKRTRVSSSKYVAFDGHTPRYFTIERPSRIAP